MVLNVLCHEQPDHCADWSQWGIRSQSYTCQRSEVVDAFEGTSETQESDVPPEAPLPEPQTIGALLLGIQGDRWPRRRWALGTQTFDMRSLASDWLENFLAGNAQVHAVSVAVHGSIYRSEVGLCTVNSALHAASKHPAHDIQLARCSGHSV